MAEGRGATPDQSWAISFEQDRVELFTPANQLLLPIWYDGLEQEVLARLERDSAAPGPRPKAGIPFTTQLRRRAALFDLYLGDHEGAREHLSKVLPGGLVTEGASDSDICREARVIVGLVDLDAGETEQAIAALSELRRACNSRRAELAARCLEMENTLRGGDDSVFLGDEMLAGPRLSAVRNGRDEAEIVARQAEELLALAHILGGAETEHFEALYMVEGHQSWNLLASWSGASRGESGALVSLMSSVTVARFVPALLPGIEIEPERLLRTTGTMEYQPGTFLSFGRVDLVIDMTPGRQRYHPVGREGPALHRDMLPELERVALRRAVAAALSHGERTRAYDAAIVRIRDAMLTREVAVPLAILERI